MMAKMVRLALVLALILTGVLPAGAQDPGAMVITALGRGQLASGQSGDARELALNDALRQAVARAAMEMVDPATLREKLGLLDREILSQARRFVSTYALQAQEGAGGTALALVSVTVDRASLDEALIAQGLRLPAARLAVTLPLVAEETSPNRPPVFWWSGAPGVPSAPPPVAMALRSMGVSLADTTSLAAQVPPESRQAVLSEDQALEMGRLAGAGLVILGRVRTFPLVTPLGETPPPAAQFVALDVASGQTLGVVEAEGPVYNAPPPPGAAQEMANAVEEAVRQLVVQVSGATPQASLATRDLIIQVQGLKSLADLHGFVAKLARMSSLVSSVEREAVGPGWASLKVGLKVPASQLADQLLLQDFGDFLVNVVSIAPDRLELNLIPR